MAAGLSVALLVAGCAVCVLAIPASLLADVKQAQASQARVSNKVKRAQEVIMFGNQQNHGGDGRNAYALPRTEKRGVDLDDNALPETVVTESPRMMDAEDLEEPKALAQTFRQSVADPDYAQRLQAAYYTDPAVLSNLRYYDLDERRKRDTFRTPAKRSSSRGLATAGRAKRDLDVDPEELLALLNYWQNKSPSAFKHQYNRNMYNPYNAIDSDDMDMLDTEGGNEISEDDDGRSDGWMDGPVSLPARHFSAGPEPWGRQRFSEDRRKRFMVAKRRPQEGDMYSLGQLLNSPQRDVPTPVFRRFVL